MSIFLFTVLDSLRVFNSVFIVIFSFYITDRITRPFKSLNSCKSCSSCWYNWRWGFFAIESWTWYNLYFLKGDIYKFCTPDFVSLLSSNYVCNCQKTSSDWIMTLWNKKMQEELTVQLKLFWRGIFLSVAFCFNTAAVSFKNRVISWCGQVSVSPWIMK